jgi:hypothetical protein
MRIRTPQKLENARRWCCDCNTITEFYAHFALLFQRDPCLIFNADETTMSGLKRFCVLVEKGKLPLVVAATKLPHLTAMYAISAIGTAFKPFVILLHLKGLKSSQNLPWMPTSRRVILAG